MFLMRKKVIIMKIGFSGCLGCRPAELRRAKYMLLIAKLLSVEVLVAARKINFARGAFS
jgi:hypothetical protein